MDISEIPTGKILPQDINVLIEISASGPPVKYEMDKKSGALFVDRFLYTSMRYPGNYGFIPQTLSGDGDPVDVLICSDIDLIPGCVINARPIGALIMEDNAGEDEKIIAVPSSRISKAYEKILEYTDLPEITLEQIAHFFAHYKDLEPEKWTKITGWQNAAFAKKIIVEAISRAKAGFSDDV